MYFSQSRTGALRPTSGPGLSKRSRNNTNNGVERHKSKLPRGMYINHDDIVKLASQDSNSRGDDLLTNMDREISTLLSQVRCIQFISILKTTTTKSLEEQKRFDLLIVGGGGWCRRIFVLTFIQTNIICLILGTIFFFNLINSGMYRCTCEISYGITII